MGGRKGKVFVHGDLFARIISLDNLFHAWEKFARGKRDKFDVQKYERHLESNIFNLREKLISGAYRHGAYSHFTIRDPKERKISKALVEDRLVHQAVCNVIEPLFERMFICDSFSCREDKGTHPASYRLRRFLRKASRNNTRTIYILKCDIQKFFDSVEHLHLFEFLQRRIADVCVLNLLKIIIGSFSKSPGKGLPLGNLTSQLFANVYLHELDRFVKYDLRQKWHVRHCDDFILAHHSRVYLAGLIPQIRDFLRNKLQLRIHARKVTLKSWSQGIDFVGYVHMPHCTVLRIKTKKRLLQRASSQNFSSYFGLCKHADTHELWQLMLNKLGANGGP